MLTTDIKMFTLSTLIIDVISSLNAFRICKIVYFLALSSGAQGH